MKKTIALLFHERDARPGSPRHDTYTIHPFARYWREAGHAVKAVFGVQSFVPADLAILHVDLSVVPDEYIEFAARYPIVLNGGIRDIRKSTFSRNLVQPDDSYVGPVIVKSDLNYAGLPERLLASGGRPTGLALRLRRLLRRSEVPRKLRRPLHFGSPTEYRVYDTPSAVPPEVFESKDLVVEKFLPEMADGLYAVRTYQFLGDRETCMRIASPHPVVKTDSRSARETVEPHPDIVAMRTRLKFDYGKFDYVIHDGRAILLDINKTPGDAPGRDAAVEARIRHRAEGLYSYLA